MSKIPGMPTAGRENSGLFLFITWIFLFGFPALFLHYSLEKWIAWKEERLIGESRKRLLDEVKDYKRELEMPVFLEKQLSEFNREFGFIDGPSPEHLGKFESLTQDGFYDIRRRIEEKTGAKISFLMFLEKKNRKLFWYVRPDSQFASEPDGMEKRMKAVASFFMNKPFPQERSSERQEMEDLASLASKEQFGENLKITTVGRNLKFFYSKYPKFGKGYYIMGDARSPNSPNVHPEEFLAKYVVMFEAANTSPYHMVRITSKGGREGFRRWIIHKPFRKIKPFVRSKDSIFFFTSLPPGLTGDKLHENFPGISRFISHGKRGGKPARVPRSQPWPASKGPDRDFCLAVESLPGNQLHSLRNFIPFIETFLALFAQGGILLILYIQLFGIPILSGLRGKVAVGFAIGASIPICGLAFLTFAYLQARQEVEPSTILSHMERNLEQFENGMEAEETKWNNRLSKLSDKLSEVIDKQPKARQVMTDSMIRSQKIGKVIFLVHVDGSENFSSEYSDPSSQKVFLSLFRGFIIEAFQKLGIFAPADGSDPFSTRFQALITMARSFAEQNFDEKLFEQLLANPGTPFPGFLGNIHQKITMFFVRNKSPGLPMRAIGILMRSSKNVVDKYLGEITRKRNDLGQIHKGYQIRYHFYKIEGLVPPLLSSSNFAADQKTWEKLVELSYRCLDGRVNIVQNNLDSAEPNLVATRIFSNEAYIGVGYAIRLRGKSPGGWTPLREGSLDRWIPLHGKTGKIGTFPIILFSSLFFLWAGITGSMAVFLTWSLPAFQKATWETSRGNFTWKLEINQRDEFGELEIAFNSMVKGLLEKEKMSRFVSEEVVEAVKSEESTALEVGGKRTFYTLLFSDIRNFTTLTEKNSPEEMVSMLNDYFTSMETCIQNHDGSISTFLGDAILAVFYEKESGIGSAQRACMAAQEMRTALENFNEFRRKTGKFTIKTGIGISYGEGLSGRIGSDSGRLVQLVLGDPVERANCLEALSKKTGGTGIIIDEEISRRITQFINFHPLPANLLPEKLKSSKIFELL